MAELPGGGYALSVGRPYIEGKTHWPEGVESDQTANLQFDKQDPLARRGRV